MFFESICSNVKEDMAFLTSWILVSCVKNCFFHWSLTSNFLLGSKVEIAEDTDGSSWIAMSQNQKIYKQMRK